MLFVSLFKSVRWVLLLSHFKMMEPEVARRHTCPRSHLGDGRARI